ncbi:hypothetical protein BDV95DRAFT_599115 [Massariosphaeria phaeospora]|uniref:Secreted protein n=1 Tax=Massariosphaeria phaeospora TaxID=100035 RepID=A0A7C8I0T4_9PLEO|nr:hypothetical protein BDV95DRAFT_599115 [Massariosphaeria phaeospora]
MIIQLLLLLLLLVGLPSTCVGSAALAAACSCMLWGYGAGASAGASALGKKPAGIAYNHRLLAACSRESACLDGVRRIRSTELERGRHLMPESRPTKHSASLRARPSSSPSFASPHCGDEHGSIASVTNELKRERFWRAVPASANMKETYNGGATKKGG